MAAMNRLSVETAQRHIIEVDGMLRAWEYAAENRADADRRYRRTEMHYAERLLKEVIEETSFEHVPTLTTGSEQAQAFTFNKGAYDFLRPVSKNMSPGSELQLKNFQILRWMYPRARRDYPESYVGSYIYMNLGEVAVTLTQGGKLELVSLEAADETPEVA
jgi:hypothetical protein